MGGFSRNLPKIAIFLVGVAAGAVSGSRRERVADPETGKLKKSIADLEAKLAVHESATEARITQVETRVEAHEARLADVPSTTQLVSAMEQVLGRTMASLDERLAAQAHSIDVLKTTVSQTDDLLERVLESIDALQSPPQDAARETGSRTPVA